MHRRQFLAASAALLLPTAPVRAAQDAVTPAATPNHHGRPRPIVLGDGIELVDYRIYPSTDVPRIIGEIVSTRDDMVDSPVVSITFPDLGDERLAWAAPVLPVMRPGESNMIFGILPQTIQSIVDLEKAEFGLCASVEKNEYAPRFADTEFTFSVTEEGYWQDSLNVRGYATNNGRTKIMFAALQGIVRDGNDRYAGAIPRGNVWSLLPGQSKDFFLWASTKHPSLADPYLLLAQSNLYSLELHVSLIDYYTAPVCRSFLT